MHIANSPSNPLMTLQRFARSHEDRERCGLCDILLTEEHRHLLEVPLGSIVCACDSCALRFHDVIEGRYKLIPRAARRLTDFKLTVPQWESLALPIQLVFFFHNSVVDKVTALYPSPAGAMESLLPLETWEEIVLENPELHGMAPDVEALLVNRLDGKEDYYVAPIDRCYELVGLVRMHWHGLSGGEEVWECLNDFFHRLEFSHA